MRTFLALALVAVVAACSAQKPPTKFPATIEVEDSPRYPEEAAGFQREEVVAFAEGRKNIAVTYSLLADDVQIAATLTYLPHATTTTELAKQVEAERKTSLDFHPGARWLTENEDLPIEKNGVSTTAKKSTYEFEGAFRGQRQQLYAEVYLWGHGDGWIVVRSTAPSWQRKKSAAKTVELIRAIDWTAADAP